MAEAATKLAVKTEKKEAAPAPREWQPFETLRREIDRLFENFHRTSWVSPFGRASFELEPFWRREFSFGAVPAVDIVEKDKAYEITAELPGMDEKNVEVTFSEGMLTIKGEKQEEKEEKKKDYYLSERRYGSFHRSMRVPEGIDADKIEAGFKKGVLTVTLPKTAEAQKKEKKIAVSSK
ncbi:MAG: Hsp20/alpha crystallin family protein [Alphaproteobacteria bacterium]|nr:Hsp20/alpha crystallin family protein [Alphaproteobacteria bacterium]